MDLIISKIKAVLIFKLSLKLFPGFSQTMLNALLFAVNSVVFNEEGEIEALLYKDMYDHAELIHIRLRLGRRPIQNNQNMPSFAQHFVVVYQRAKRDTLNSARQVSIYFRMKIIFCSFSQKSSI